MSEDSPNGGHQRTFLLIEPSEYNLIILVLRRLFLCLLLLFLMGLGALAMWMDTDRRYSGFFLALVAFSGTLAVVRRGTHLHDGDNIFADDDDIINTYLNSPAESPKHCNAAYRHQHAQHRGPPPQFSEEDPEQGASGLANAGLQAAHAAHHSSHCPQQGWLVPPPPYHMACPEPPPAYFDVVPVDLMSNADDPSQPSTSSRISSLPPPSTTTTVPIDEVIFANSQDGTTIALPSPSATDAGVSAQSTLEGNASTQTSNNETQVLVDGIDASTGTRSGLTQQALAATGSQNC